MRALEAAFFFFCFVFTNLLLFFEADNRQRKRGNIRKGANQLISSSFAKFIYLFPVLASF